METKVTGMTIGVHGSTGLTEYPFIGIHQKSLTKKSMAIWIVAFAVQPPIESL